MTTPRDRGFRADPVRPLAMLSTCPAHRPTPLRRMNELAAALGLQALWVKDETERMGLGSFKALGGAFAIAQLLRDAHGHADLASDAARRDAAGVTFVTASAGNHGLSVAAGARVFGAQAVIVLGSDAPEGFVARLRSKGARVERVAGLYDDAVARARALSDAEGWLLLADGSWPGYVDRSALVMEGYAVMAEECRAAFAEAGDWPDLVLLQAGVGGMAAAMTAHVRDRWPIQPRIVVVEPDAAPCLRDSVAAGRLTRAAGPVSSMGRLDCKEASLLAFESLRRDADAFVAVSDAAAEAAAARLMARGLPTTPSGAAGLAALSAADAGASALIVVTEAAL